MSETLPIGGGDPATAAAARQRLRQGSSSPSALPSSFMLARENAQDLIVFVAVANELSFSRAAEALGMSRSALSHTIRGLEARLGVRLLSRTTRSVATTEMGERLLASIAPLFGDIERDLRDIVAARDKAIGTIRIAADAAGVAAVSPALARYLAAHPDVSLELVPDDGSVDIVASRCDAGIRTADLIERDMIAVPVGPATRFIVVAAPSYLRKREVPQIPADLKMHHTVQLHGAAKSRRPWRFIKGGNETEIVVTSQLTVPGFAEMSAAALVGCGLAYMPERLVAHLLDDGRLVRVLSDWCAPVPQHHLYYANRREHPAAFRLFVEAVRYREAGGDTPLQFPSATTAEEDA